MGKLGTMQGYRREQLEQSRTCHMCHETTCHMCMSSRHTGLRGKAMERDGQCVREQYGHESLRIEEPPHISLHGFSLFSHCGCEMGVARQAQHWILARILAEGGFMSCFHRGVYQTLLNRSEKVWKPHDYQ